MTYTPPAPGSDQEFAEDLAYLRSLAPAMIQRCGTYLPYPAGPTLHAQLCDQLTLAARRALFQPWPTFKDLWDAA